MPYYVSLSVNHVNYVWLLYAMANLDNLVFFHVSLCELQLFCGLYSADANDNGRSLSFLTYNV